MLFERLLVDQVLLVFGTVSEFQSKFVEGCASQVDILVLVLLIEEFVKVVPDLVNFANFCKFSIRFDPLSNGYIEKCWEFWGNWLLRDHADIAEAYLLLRGGIQVNVIRWYQMLRYILVETGCKVPGLGLGRGSPEL